MEQTTKDALSHFLKHNDCVLICCSQHSPTGVAMARSISAYGGIPVFWSGDFRWSALLREAFTGKHRVIAGPPLLLLGLSKLSKQLGVPLYVRNVLLLGECADWIRESIEQGLDCKTWAVPGEFVHHGCVEDLWDLKEQILRWSSVLDCRVIKGTYGLEMQIINFPGKKLPHFPTCAKLDIQAFDRERHIPFYIAYHPKNPGIYLDNH